MHPVNKLRNISCVIYQMTFRSVWSYSAANRISKFRVNGNSLKAICLFGYALKVNAFNTDNLVSWKPNHMLMIWSGVWKQNCTLTMTELHTDNLVGGETKQHTDNSVRGIQNYTLTIWCEKNKTTHWRWQNYTLTIWLEGNKATLWRSSQSNKSKDKKQQLQTHTHAENGMVRFFCCRNVRMSYCLSLSRGTKSVQSETQPHTAVKPNERMQGFLFRTPLFQTPVF